MRKTELRLARQASDIEVVYAVREYVQNGVRYCDVVNPDNGQQPAMQCPILGGEPLGVPEGGWGPKSNLLKYPLVIIGRRSDGRQPIVLGRLANPALVYTPGAPTKDGAQTGATQTSNTTSPTAYGVGDHVIANGGTTFVLRKDGNTTLDADGSVNIQLTNGVLRVTQDGDAEDRALLASPTVTKLNELIASYTALLTALNAAATAAAAPGVPDPGAVFVATLNGALGAVPAVDSAVLAELQSAVLHLSATAGP